MPTRELGVQVYQVTKQLSQFINISVALSVGGLDVKVQVTNYGNFNLIGQLNCQFYRCTTGTKLMNGVNSSLSTNVSPMQEFSFPICEHISM